MFAILSTVCGFSKWVRVNYTATALLQFSLIIFRLVFSLSQNSGVAARFSINLLFILLSTRATSEWVWEWAAYFHASAARLFLIRLATRDLIFECVYMRVQKMGANYRQSILHTGNIYWETIKYVCVCCCVWCLCTIEHYFWNTKSVLKIIGSTFYLRLLEFSSTGRDSRSKRSRKEKIYPSIYFLISRVSAQKHY